MTLTDATKQMLYLRTFCNFINLSQPDGATLYCDDKADFSLTDDKPGQHSIL